MSRTTTANTAPQRQVSARLATITVLFVHIALYLLLSARVGSSLSLSLSLRFGSGLRNNCHHRSALHYGYRCRASLALPHSSSNSNSNSWSSSFIGGELPSTMGDAGINVTNDGGVTKSVIRRGNPLNGYPSNEDSVEIIWKIYLMDGTLVHDSCTLDEIFDFQIGAQPREVILGWEYAVKTMLEGEVASFVLQPEYAFGAKGAMPLVPPNTAIRCEIELKEIIPSFKKMYKPVGSEESVREELMQKIQSGETPLAQGVMDGEPMEESRAKEKAKMFDPAKHKLDPNQRVRGEADAFVWEENPRSIEVEVQLPRPLKKADLTVEITSTAIKVQIASTGEILLGGELHGKILPSQSMWAIAEPEVGAWSAHRVILSLEKAFGFTEIWANVLKRTSSDLGGDDDENNILQ